MSPLVALGIGLGLTIGVIWYEFIEPRTQAIRRTVAGGKNRKYSFQQYLGEAKVRPFVLETGADEDSGLPAEIVIPVPTGEDLLEATDNATSIRRMLRIICGDQYDAVLRLVGPQPASVMTDLLADLMSHFGAGGAPGDSARPSS